MRDRARRARRAGGRPARGRRHARARREPVQARLWLGRAAARDGRRARRCCAGASSRRSASTRTSSGSASSRPRWRALEGAGATAREYAAPCGDFERIGRYRRARQEVERASPGGGPRRPARRARGHRGRAGTARPRPPARGAELAVILGVHAIRGHRALVDALLRTARVVRVKAGVIKRIFWATPPLHVPRDREPGRPRGLHHLASSSAALGPRSDRSRARAGAGGDAGQHRVSSLPVGRDPACDRAWRERRPHERAPRAAAATLETVRGAYWQEFLRVVEVLEQFGAVHDRALTTKGRLVAGLRHDNGCWWPRPSAGASSTTSRWPRPRRCARRSSRSRARASRTSRGRSCAGSRSSGASSSSSIGVAEGVRGPARPPPRDAGQRAPRIHARRLPLGVRATTTGSAIVEQDFGGHEGDLIRAMRRLIDVLRQLAESPGGGRRETAPPARSGGAG